MKEQFNFGDFLLENGFAYTNYGAHNLYEFEKDGHNFAVNIQADRYSENSSKPSQTLKSAQELPKSTEDAQKWLSGFIGTEAKTEAEPVAEKPKPTRKTASKK